MGEGGEEVERRAALGGGHLGAILLHEAVPFALALRALRELDQSGARGERRQPDVVEVLGRILTLLHAARRLPHCADAKALARGSIRAESNNSDGHSGSRSCALSKAGLDRFSLRTTLALINAAAAEDTKLPIPTMSHT